MYACRRGARLEPVRPVHAHFPRQPFVPRPPPPSTSRTTQPTFPPPASCVTNIAQAVKQNRRGTLRRIRRQRMPFSRSTNWRPFLIARGLAVTTTTSSTSYPPPSSEHMADASVELAHLHLHLDAVPRHPTADQRTASPPRGGLCADAVVPYGRASWFGIEEHVAVDAWQRTHSMVKQHILSYENTFYNKRTHSIVREHIL